MPHVHHPFWYFYYSVSAHPPVAEAAADQLEAILASEDVCVSMDDSAGALRDVDGEVSRCPLQPRICAGEESLAS